MAAVFRELAVSPLAQEFRFAFLFSHKDAAGPLARVWVFATALVGLVLWCARPGRRVVHLHTAKHGSWYRKAVCVVAARALRRRVLLQLHSGPGDIAASWNSLPRHTRVLLRLAFARADRVASVSAAGARELADRFGLDDVQVVPNAVPRAWLAPLAAPPRHDEHKPVVLYLGGFQDPAKGGEVLLDAIAHLAEADGLPVRLVLAGPGQLPPEAHTLLAREPDVRWDGWLDEDAKRDALSRADIVTLPSVSEGLPLALLEAMAAGRAVVATRSGGMPEVVTDGVDGYLVQPGDAVALSSALRRLAADPPRREALGRAAHARVARLAAPDVYEPLARLYYELAPL